ncbi:hypothetical protein OB2597_00870 [Pseudooceanicola batsensis HTCC2597]|uniref:Periplasmic heavy metal sensor n=1 Tax=Pseudooceanicola batsensis (strain ATCC BAA-863 / DSM 15984 / KCTC 12145 / HTCC2597) TaxID=252305 RepID=A3U1Z1_PSEBH|nr:periplasmic heavy metal sensor [Pseudooceanicola batsensis]EAQ01925.1 hypothetical protein OB2597_00870 [Pseudooceanicola batsensis HTCC2597]
MSHPPDTKGPGGRLGWLRWLLFASLALNLLIAGIVVGHAVADPPDRRVPRVDRIGGPLTFALDHEDRRAIGKALRREYREARPSRSEIAGQYRNAIAALRADPYDPEQLETVFENQLDAARERMEIGQRLLLERIAAMDPTERRAFADRLEEGVERHGRFSGKSGKQDR